MCSLLPKEDAMGLETNEIELWFKEIREILNVKAFNINFCDSQALLWGWTPKAAGGQSPIGIINKNRRGGNKCQLYFKNLSI